MRYDVEGCIPETGFSPGWVRVNLYYDGHGPRIGVEVDMISRGSWEPSIRGNAWRLDSEADVDRYKDLISAASEIAFELPGFLDEEGVTLDKVRDVFLPSVISGHVDRELVEATRATLRDVVDAAIAKGAVIADGDVPVVMKHPDHKASFWVAHDQIPGTDGTEYTHFRHGTAVHEGDLPGGSRDGFREGELGVVGSRDEREDSSRLDSW